MKTLALVGLLLLVSNLVGADDLVLTTYYPAPNGQYLDMDISDTLTGNVINAAGAITAAAFVVSEGISLRSGIVRFSVSRTGDVNIGGTLNMSGGAIANVLTLTVQGKITTAATVNDIYMSPGTTVVTKDYVDHRMKPGINYGACAWIGEGGGNCPANYVIVGISINPPPVGGEFYDFLCCALN